MRVTKNTLRYVLVAIVTMLVLGLGWWYFFLKAQESTITQVGESRGLGSPLPQFPEQTGSTSGNLSSAATQPGTDIQTNRTPPQLWKVTRTPIAGMGYDTVPLPVLGAPQKLLFAERGTGYIFEADPETGTLTRLSNRLLPGTYEALFAGKSVILRGLDEDGVITTFSGTVTPQETEDDPTSDIATSTKEESETLPGLYLSENIREIAADTKTRELIYLMDRGVEGSEVIRSSWNGGTRRTVLTSALANWKLFFLPDGKTYVSQKPADNIPGYAYELRTGGTLSPLVKDIPGLSILPRSSSTAILYSTSEDGALTLYARADAIGAVRFPIRTVADKCVWAPSSAATASKLIAYCAVPQAVSDQNFIDNWYQGKIHTSDAWWRIEVLSGEVDLLYSDTSEPIDVENPIMEDNGDTIAFMNARDKTLWVLRIAGETQPASTEE